MIFDGFQDIETEVKLRTLGENLKKTIDQGEDRCQLKRATEMSRKAGEESRDRRFPDRQVRQILS